MPYLQPDHKAEAGLGLQVKAKSLWGSLLRADPPSPPLSGLLTLPTDGLVVCCHLGIVSSSRGIENKDGSETPHSYVSLYRKHAAPCLWQICGPISYRLFTP